ncbi:MAG: 23S rRNA (adenine2503-C2)-methyltransferase [Planctomycetota bacterium]|jgi:23S rRNA (adenine2503-C2)-methyltransferase
MQKELQDIRCLSEKDLETFLLENKEPKFRAKQIYQWLWNKGASEFDQMTNLSLELRDKLKADFIIPTAKVKMTQRAIDGTMKAAFNLRDNRVIEGVLIPTEKRMTACVSSQVGCTLACAFCATGTLKRDRNLDAGEIYDQVVAINDMALKAYKKPLTNIVYMGMGEPLLNYKNVIGSIDKITSPDGLNMSPRRITISTVGIAKGIIKLADEGKKFNLALSLHAATDSKRRLIMDITNSNPIDKVMEAIKYFYEKTGNKITFEYILFKDINDTREDAMNLIKLCKQFPVFVNLIEYNPVEGLPFEKASQENAYMFLRLLESRNITAKIRVSRGKDIDAACGQLANREK